MSICAVCKIGSICVGDAAACQVRRSKLPRCSTLRWPPPKAQHTCTPAAASLWRTEMELGRLSTFFLRRLTTGGGGARGGCAIRQVPWLRHYIGEDCGCFVGLALQALSPKTCRCISLATWSQCRVLVVAPFVDADLNIASQAVAKPCVLRAVLDACLDTIRMSKLCAGCRCLAFCLLGQAR